MATLIAVKLYMAEMAAAADYDMPATSMEIFILKLIRMVEK